MHRRRTTILNCTVLLLCVSTAGCLRDSVHYRYLTPDRALAYYKDQAVQIEHPQVNTQGSGTAHFTNAPRTLEEPGEENIDDMTLAEAIRIGLSNNAIIRDVRAIANDVPSSVLTNPDGTPSVYDVAIQQSGFLFGNRGVEAALAEFDANFLTSMTWGRGELVQNTATTGLRQGSILVDETANFSSRIEKRMGDGSTFGVQHDWNYSLNNVPTTNVLGNSANRLFASAYSGFLRADYRRPLLAGSGVEFTRIAGPIDSNLRGVSGVSQGVVISRINEDIRISDFEGRVATLVRGIEDLYRRLHLQYQLYEIERVAMQVAYDSIARTKSREDQLYGNDLIEVEVIYQEGKVRLENALSDLYETEAVLRQALGLPVNDGRLIRPIDELPRARFTPDWHMSLAQALVQRPELRQQKWNIKSLELQYRAACNLLRPRLDLVARYQVNGFGDHLFGDNDGSGNPPPSTIQPTLQQTVFRSAYDDLVGGAQTEWSVGAQFLLPFGLRRAHSRLKNQELRLAKARRVLQMQEEEISHQLGRAIQRISRWYKSAQTNAERVKRANELVQTMDTLMYDPRFAEQVGAGNAQARAYFALRDAHIARVQSLWEYSNAITAYHFNMGATLAQNNIHLSEGLWEPGAYADALERAWERTFARDTQMLHSEPIEFLTNPGANRALIGTAPRGAPASPAANSPADVREVPSPQPESDEAPHVEPHDNMPADSEVPEVPSSLPTDPITDLRPPSRSVPFERRAGTGSPSALAKPLRPRPPRREKFLGSGSSRRARAARAAAHDGSESLHETSPIMPAARQQLSSIETGTNAAQNVREADRVVVSRPLVGAQDGFPAGSKTLPASVDSQNEPVTHRGRPARSAPTPVGSLTRAGASSIPRPLLATVDSLTASRPALKLRRKCLGAGRPATGSALPQIDTARVRRPPSSADPPASGTSATGLRHKFLGTVSGERSK